MHSRKLLFLGMACSVILLAGCGNDTHTYAPDGEVSYRVNNFGGQNRATVLVTNQSNAEETEDEGYISVTNKAASQSLTPAARAAAEKDEAITASRSRSTALIEAAEPLLANRKNNPINAKVTPNTVYTDTAKGEDIQINAYKNVQSLHTVTVRKMLDNTETDGSIIFAEVVDGAPVLTEADALKMDEIFSTKNTYDTQDKGISERVRTTFGSEWRKDGGMDGTEKVILVALCKDCIGESVYGYFNPADAYTKAEAKDSNEGEILYFNCDARDFDIFSTLGHEFQHMCNYNQKVIHDGAWDGHSESTNINEGQSVLAEDLCGFSLNTAGGGNSFILNVMNSYLANPEKYSYNIWNSNAAGSYGVGYFVSRYIADEYGVKAITDIATSKDTGIQNISSVLGENFAVTFKNLGLTVLLDPMTGANDYKFSSIKLDKDYTILDEGGATVKHLNAVAPFEGEVADKGYTLTLLPWTNSYITYANGSGNALEIFLDLPFNSGSSLVVETSPNVFEYLQ